MEWKEFLPDKITAFKISHSDKLLEGSLKLYDYLESHNGFAYTHYYRKHFIRHDFYKTKLQPEVKDIIYNDILKPIGAENHVESIKIEKIDAPRHEHQFQYKKSTRLENLPAALNPIDPEFTYGSGLWHIDSNAPENNMVMLVYLNDVDESTGPFSIAYPPVLMQQSHLTPTEYKDTASIPSVSILGRAGTVVCFHSYLLHRGNVPIFGHRKAILISVLPEEEKYFHKLGLLI